MKLSLHKRDHPCASATASKDLSAMAATKLRRIFKYDSDEDATPWILDEEGESIWRRTNVNID